MVNDLSIRDLINLSSKGNVKLSSLGNPKTKGESSMGDFMKSMQKLMQGFMQFMKEQQAKNIRVFGEALKGNTPDIKRAIHN